MRKTILLLVLAATAAAASAQTYKWRDSSGRIQYSDTPPPASAKDIQQLRKVPGSAGAASAASGSKSLAEQDADFRKRLGEKQEADAKQAKAEEEERIRARNCEQAKGQLAALEAGGRMVQLDAKGERIALDDADREQAKLESRKAVENWCK